MTAPAISSRLRVGMNLLMIQRSGVIGGVESYVHNILEAIRKTDRKNEYYIFCNKLPGDVFGKTDDNVHIVEIDEHSFISRGLRYLQFHGVLRRLPRMPLDVEVENRGIDVMFYPCTIIFPSIRAKIPIVLTIADIQHVYYPEFFSRGELRHRSMYYENSARCADRIIAVSEYTKKSLIEEYGISADKIDVIHETIGEEFFSEIPERQLDQLCLRYHLVKGFLLYPAATWPHKNHRRLFEALAIVKKNTGSSPVLVLTGMRMKNQETVESDIRGFGLVDTVRMLGYVPREDMPALYRCASGLVFPSLFEGFGIPLVEAMASGVPIACSRSTSLPEVAGDAALYFDPLDPADIAATIHRLLNDRAARTTLRENAHRQMEKFSPSRIAQKKIDVFHRAALTHGQVSKIGAPS